MITWGYWAAAIVTRMNSLIYLIVLFGIVLVSCSNDNEDAIQQAILGKWN